MPTIHSRQVAPSPTVASLLACGSQSLPNRPTGSAQDVELSLLHEVHSQDALGPSSKFPTSMLSTCPKTGPGGPRAYILSLVCPHEILCSQTDQKVGLSCGRLHLA